MKTSRIVIVITISFITLFCINGSLATTQVGVKINVLFDLGDPSPAELYVMRQLSSGRVADLKEEFGDDESSRFIRASFLKALLTNDIEDLTIHQHGVHIENAIIYKPFYLTSADISHNVVLKGCRFYSDVYLNGTHFGKILVLEGTNFYKKADFQLIKVDQNLSIEKSSFKGLVNFSGANISGEFVSKEAQFENDGLGVIFNGMRIDHDAFFNKAIFWGPVFFRESSFGKNLYLRNAQFKNRIKEVTFESMKVVGSLSLEDTKFNGPTIFAGVEIGQIFNGNRTEFKNKDRGVDFNLLKAGNVSLCGAIFDGPLTCGFMQIRNNMMFSPDTDQGKQTTIKDSVNFIGSTIGNNFLADQINFDNSE